MPHLKLLSMHTGVGLQLPCSARCSAVKGPKLRRAPVVRSLWNEGSGGAPAESSGQEQPTQPQLTPWDNQGAAARVPRIVMTQRGIPDVRQEIPDDPCPACGGTGKVLCGNCRGKGRLNFRSAPMLPHGVWPAWCPCCRASGRWYCERCMGTGVKRDQIGFRL